MGLRYGGKIVSDYSAMRGPCPVGFHVPKRNELEGIISIIETLQLPKTLATVKTYLKMPPAGSRRNTSGNPSGSGSNCYFWSCDNSSAVRAWQLGATSSQVLMSSPYKTGGESIRPFKDKPVPPNNSWTTLYDGSSISNGAGIFHNATDGLISMSGDGVTWVTISDKNLGATNVYNSGDTLSDANCGNFFQRGNNFGFPRTGNVTTSSTQADTTGYGPGNYYSSSTFIIGNQDWSSTTKNDLRGGVTGVQQRPAPIKKRYYGGKMVNDYSAMQGPCPVGFHVPSKSEFQTITNAGIAIGAWNSDGTGGTNMLSYLKIPLAGYHGTNISGAGTSYQDKQVFLWCCTATSTYYGDTLRFGGTTSTYNDKWKIETYIGRGGGNFIRPIKDIPVAPDGNWTTLYNGSSTSVGAGIFHNPTLGLISISSDGTNWTTIADKNLGATVVYNSGDTLSESNCGGWFQWGNNYMFPFSSSFTYATEQVDATNYGPGNYYSSSTYIGKEKWDTSNNKNLRGGVTGVQQRPAEVIKVYKGNTLIREKP